MKLNICGIEHSVIEVEDMFDVDMHLGMIDYDKCVIKLNSKLAQQLKEATLCHEIVHAMLLHIGRDDLSNDEQFVTALGNAINNTFSVKEVKEL